MEKQHEHYINIANICIKRYIIITTLHNSIKNAASKEASSNLSIIIFIQLINVTFYFHYKVTT